MSNTTTTLTQRLDAAADLQRKVRMATATTTTTNAIHVIQPGRAGDEEMVHYAASYGFECDPSLVHYWFTARKAYAWLRGNGFTVEHEASLSLADLDEMFAYKS